MNPVNKVSKVFSSKNENNKSQNIAFFLFSLEGGGAERVASVFANHLIKNREVHLILMNDPIDFDLNENIKIKKLRPFYNWRLFRIFTLLFIPFQLAKYLRQNQIDIVFSFGTFANVSNCMIAPFFKKKQFWIRISSITSILYGEDSWRNRILRKLISINYEKADRIFSNSERIQIDLRQKFRINKKVELLRNPIKLNLKKKGRKNVEEPYIFINIGSFKPVKNHTMLVEAFSKFKGQNVELWLLGKGNDEQKIKNLVSEKGLNEQVKFHGFQPNPIAFLHKANCFVFTSDYEGSPNVLIEALSSGIAVVATDCISGPREILAPDTSMKQLAFNDDFEQTKFGMLSPVRNAETFAAAMQKIMEEDFISSEKEIKNNLEKYSIDSILESAAFN